jgi:hypothetical protein
MQNIAELKHQEWPVPLYELGEEWTQDLREGDDYRSLCLKSFANGQ